METIACGSAMKKSSVTITLDAPVSARSLRPNTDRTSRPAWIDPAS
jgi:hypothetical protein